MTTHIEPSPVCLAKRLGNRAIDRITPSEIGVLHNMVSTADRNSFSKAGQAAFDIAMRGATDKQTAARQFEIKYLQGELGRTFELDTESELTPIMQRAAYDYGAEAAKTSLGKVTYNTRAKVSDNLSKSFEKAAKDLNVHITYGGKAPVVNGVQDRAYITSAGELRIYEDIEVKLADGRVLKGDAAATMVILGHEMTHRLQQLDGQSYAVFRDFVLARKSGAIEEYMKAGMSRDTAVDEIVADYAMTTLFADQKTINEVTKKHSKLAEAVRDILEWIKTKLGIQSSELDRAIRLWNNAYNASVRNAKSNAKTKNTADGDAKYSAIRLDNDGNEFVDVDVTTTVDSTHTGEQIATILSDIVKTKFTDFVKVKGQKIGINQKTAGEWHMSKSAQALKRLDYGMFLDKANAFNNADELLKVAKNYIGEAKKHTRKDNFVEFARGVVNFKVGANGYAADIIVGTTKSGVAILYDIVNVQKKKIASMPDTTQDRRLGTLANNNVPQNIPVVNTQSMQNSQNNTLGDAHSIGGTEELLYNNGAYTSADIEELIREVYGEDGNYTQMSIATGIMYSAMRGETLTSTDIAQIAGDERLAEVFNTAFGTDIDFNSLHSAYSKANSAIRKGELAVKEQENAKSNVASSENMSYTEDADKEMSMIDFDADYSDEELKLHIKNKKVNLTILDGKQGKHILGHNNYINGKSYLVEGLDVQKLINKYAGTGELLRDKNGNWNHKEAIISNDLIGYDVSFIDGKETPTKSFTIHYSKNGVHIVPREE